jgi:hypothetical protein
MTNRWPVHLAVLAGTSASMYAVALATIAMLQSGTDAQATADRAPMALAADTAASTHDSLERAVDDAAQRYSAVARRYEDLAPRLGDLQGALEALAASTAAITKSAGSLPTRVSLPQVQVAPAPRAARPASNATTGASGG